VLDCGNGKGIMRVWTKRVERWQASGLTADEFASEVGIKSNTLRQWRWLLDHEKGGSRPDTARSARSREVPFVEVVTLAAPGSPSVEPIELLIRDRIRIRVPAAFDADALRRVIAAVEAR
jgi:transposase